jgi:dTDP-4-dehydrorhamnose 3,5-epimerase
VQPVDVRQVVVTASAPNALRGMHYHLRQSDLLYVTSGRAFVALLDLREHAAAPETFWLGNDETLLIPPGVAHGYATVESATMAYLLTKEADGTDEHGFRYDDAAAAIPWPVARPLLSSRDQNAGTLDRAIAHVRAAVGSPG